jgi:hypothetical protein
MTANRKQTQQRTGAAAGEPNLGHWGSDDSPLMSHHPYGGVVAVSGCLTMFRAQGLGGPYPRKQRQHLTLANSPCLHTYLLSTSHLPSMRRMLVVYLSANIPLKLPHVVYTHTPRALSCTSEPPAGTLLHAMQQRQPTKQQHSAVQARCWCRNQMCWTPGSAAACGPSVPSAGPIQRQQTSRPSTPHR